MQFIINFLTVLNFLAWIVFDVICWVLTGKTLGWIGIIGFIAFCIAWCISGEATLATRDYFRKTIWQRFTTKLKWANTATVVVMFLLLWLFYLLDWCGMKEFIDITIQG